MIALDTARPADQDMVGAGHGMVGEDIADQSAQAALHAVADDRIANFLGHREADADERIIVRAMSDEQDKAGHRRALAAVGGKEVGALR